VTPAATPLAVTFVEKHAPDTRQVRSDASTIAIACASIAPGKTPGKTTA
jgi:hypothetical protein